MTSYFRPIFLGMRRFQYKVCVFLSLLILTGCDYNAVRQLGSKIGARGQDVASGTVTALTSTKDLEPEDYAQRSFIAVVVLPVPPKGIPTVPHDTVLDEVDSRIEAYRQLGKAYEAIQQLSDNNFADQAGKAQQALVNSINNVAGIQALPPAVAEILPKATSIIVERKQVRAIKRYSKDLEQISGAYMALIAV